MRAFAFALGLLLTCLASLAMPAQGGDAAAEIEDALKQWTTDFNAGRAKETCDLFAPDLRADVRGLEERGYDEQCDLLKRSLADADRHYAYALDIEEILVFGDVAVVRLVWTLTVKEKDGAESKSVEQGMDLFRRQADGNWRIIRYIAYER